MKGSGRTSRLSISGCRTLVNCSLGHQPGGVREHAVTMRHRERLLRLPVRGFVIVVVRPNEGTEWAWSWRGTAFDPCLEFGIDLLLSSDLEHPANGPFHMLWRDLGGEVAVTRYEFVEDVLIANEDSQHEAVGVLAVDVWTDPPHANTRMLDPCARY